MTHVLMVCLVPPYPPHDGTRLRTWHLLAPLAKHLDITILAWSADDPTESVKDAIAGVGELVVVPTRPVDLRRGARWRRQLRFLFGAPPPFVQEGVEERSLDTPDGRRALDRTVMALHERKPIDIVVFEDEKTFVQHFPDVGAPRAVHKLNVFARIVADLRRVRLSHRLAFAVERFGWSRFDRESVAGADLVIATTPETELELRRIAPNVPVAVVTNGIEPRRQVRLGTDVAFIGRMDLDVNVDAIQWFVRESWPEIASACPDARLRIVGIDPVPAVRGLASDRVVVTGEVTDMSEACDGVGVGVVPLRGGMGIKNKTLDLMAMGIPVVTTASGAEAIDAESAGIVVVDDAAGMARSVIQLLGDTGRAVELGGRGRAYVEQHHAWSTEAERLRRTLLETIERARR